MNRIKFPTVHIAESVLSRILDTADQLGLGPGSHRGPALAAAAPAQTAAEPAPDPMAVKSAVLDVKTLVPPAEEVPPLESSPVPENDELAGILARGDNIISA